MLKKIFTLGIILSFLGVCIHPAFAIDNRRRISQDESVEDCGCKKKNNSIRERICYWLDNKVYHWINTDFAHYLYFLKDKHSGKTIVIFILALIYIIYLLPVFPLILIYELLDCESIWP